MNNKEMKQCKSKRFPERACGIIKPIDQFNNGNSLCKICQLLYNKQYEIDHKESRAQSKKLYKKEHEKEIKEYQKEYSKTYTAENKEAKKEYDKQYNKTHKEERKLYRQQNKDQIKLQKKQYDAGRKEEKNKYKREKLKNDPISKLQTYISTRAYKEIKASGSSKEYKPTKQFLPQSGEEIWARIEALFTLSSNLTPDGKVWMTKENWTIYDEKTWDDNNSSTWTWNIDHIEPHSNFPYTDLDSDNYRKCWDINNLRPLSAKQNIEEGNNRTQAQIFQIKKDIAAFMKIYSQNNVEVIK